ncbi:MAG: hypothetical protein ABIE74_05365 [Pseudomonadota bacterium]
MVKNISTGRHIEWGNFQLDTGILRRAKMLHSVATDVIKSNALAENFGESSFSGEIKKTIAFYPFDAARQRLVFLTRGVERLIDNPDQTSEILWSPQNTLLTMLDGARIFIKTGEEQIETTRCHLSSILLGMERIIAKEDKACEIILEKMNDSPFANVAMEKIREMYDVDPKFQEDENDKLKEFLRRICSSSFGKAAIEEFVANVFDVPYDPERKIDAGFAEWLSHYIMKNLMPEEIEEEMPDSWRNEVDLSEPRTYTQIQDNSPYERLLAIKIINRFPDPRFLNVVEKMYYYDGGSESERSVEVAMALGMIEMISKRHFYPNGRLRDMSFADLYTLGLIGESKILVEMMSSANVETRFKGAIGLFKMAMVKKVYDILENISSSAAHLYCGAETEDGRGTVKL